VMVPLAIIGPIGMKSSRSSRAIGAVRTTVPWQESRMAAMSALDSCHNVPQAYVHLSVCASRSIRLDASLDPYPWARRYQARAATGSGCKPRTPRSASIKGS
jgi:hypothetical protein